MRILPTAALLLVLACPAWAWGARAGVTGLVPRPDGLLRYENVRLAN